MKKRAPHFCCSHTIKENENTNFRWKMVHFVYTILALVRFSPFKSKLNAVINFQILIPCVCCFICNIFAAIRFRVWYTYIWRKKIYSNRNTFTVYLLVNSRAEVEYINVRCDAMWMGRLMPSVATYYYYIHACAYTSTSIHVRMIHIIVYSIDGTVAAVAADATVAVDDDDGNDVAVEMDTQHDIHLFNILSRVSYKDFHCIFRLRFWTATVPHHHPHGIKCYLLHIQRPYSSPILYTVCVYLTKQQQQMANGK